MLLDLLFLLILIIQELNRSSVSLGVQWPRSRRARGGAGGPCALGPLRRARGAAAAGRPRGAGHRAQLRPREAAPRGRTSSRLVAG